MAVGGEAAARLLPSMGAPTSADTVLRVLRRMPIPPRAPPRVLGVDEWAWRKGHTYGTILVDLERRVAVDLLPGRSAEGFARWLVEHPGVEIIARDRSEIYAEGARRGAPEAVQVVDRWHLLKNVSDLVERVLQRHRKELDHAVAASTAETTAEACGERLPAPDAPSRSKSSSSMTRPRLPRQQWFEQIHALRQAGMSVHGIARALHLSRPTVRKYLLAPSCPPRAPRRTKLGALSAFDDHLRARWAEGCRDAVTLWGELQARGFRGSYRTVQRHVARWRAQQPASPPPPRAPSPRQARWWLLMPEARRAPKQSRFVQVLLAQCEAIATTHALAVGFGRLVHAHDVDALAGWMTAATGSTLPELRDFAQGLRRDGAAVHAAIALPWSNGQTEGQVNRLKMLKRQMYGRASLGLLRQRLLYAA
jgi:transposase